MMYSPLYDAKILTSFRAFYLSLGHAMIRRAADMGQPIALQILLECLEEEGRVIVRESPRAARVTAVGRIT